MTEEQILTLLPQLAALVPIPLVQAMVPILIQLYRDVEASGVLSSREVDLSTLGDRNRAAFAALAARLAETA